MSGPKDYVFVLMAARLAAMAARRAEMQQARRAAADARREATRTRMRGATDLAANRRAVLAERARTDSEKKLRAMTQQNARQLAAARGLTETTASSTNRLEEVLSAARDGLSRLDRALELSGDPQRELLEHALEGLADASADATQMQLAENLRQQIAETADRVERQQQRWQEATVSLNAWQELLPEDDSVQQFCSGEAKQWLDEASKFVDRKATLDTIEDLAVRAEDLCRRAEAIHASAGDKRSRFDDRNELLRDMLESLQEIGFFVADPAYENPNDPAGPVIIKATRGSEEVCASVDLTDTVRTVWNGVADEKCKDAFFDYVDQMGKKGVDVRPTRDDLKSRPKLKQAGARELPRSTARGEGA